MKKEVKMILCEDEFPKILDEISNFLRDENFSVELVFVRSDEMREINLQNRGIDKSTDVLSFPLNSLFCGDLLGSVVINLDMALSEANSLGHSLDDEIALLFTHGFLHILGFDHEVDSGEMRVKECEVIDKFLLPKSLIVRNEA